MQKLDNYEFTLVLEGASDETPHLEDSLFAAGCDDALINFRYGTVYLDFTREAESLEDAIISAIKAVENCRLNAKVISILPDELVNETDIAKRLNKSRQLVSLWVKKARRQNKPFFPSPIAKLAEKSPLWRWREVVEWLYQQRLLKDRKAVDQANFIENLNAILAERDPRIKQQRTHIFNKLK